jgi:acyl-CoA reductase-like NAD-dependent aldehyde dehydrogenase
VINGVGGAMPAARSFIDGQDVGQVNDVLRSPHDPRTVMGEVAWATPEEAKAAVAAAVAAQPAWEALGPVERGQRLFQAAAAVEAHVEELAQLAAGEMGKPVAEARGEAWRAVHILRYFAGEGWREHGSVIPAANPSTLQWTRRVPLGVVALICPWNFPLAIPAWKLAPALVYGNTVVLKPAEWASATAYALVRLIAGALPPGVLNLVVGAGRTVGQALVEDERVAGISFTGSTGVGASIAAAATARGAKYQLEMGGKNPVIVCDDADLERAVELTVSGAMRSAGQKCTATSRVIVLPRIRRAFTERLVERVKSLRQGDPRQEDTYLGPLVSAPQRDKVEHYIARGREEGARLLVGGGRPGGPLEYGYYVEPTVFDEVAPTMAIAQEEIFGPVVGIVPADTLDDAWRIANGVRYGLSASVMTRDLNTALEAVQRLQVGLVRVNEETAGVELQAPFGGMKQSSSHSREQGPAAREFYTQTQTVAIRPG